jgi:hypothetical protein
MQYVLLGNELPVFGKNFPFRERLTIKSQPDAHYVAPTGKGTAPCCPHFVHVFLIVAAVTHLAKEAQSR